MKLQRADYAALGASLIWGFNFSSVKIALTYVPPFAMGLLRFLIAGLAIIVLLRQIEGNVRVSRPDLRRLILAGIIGFGLQQICFLYGARYLDASLSALLTAFTTAIMIVIASLIAHERLTPLVVCGVLIACLGMGGVVIGKGAAFLLTASSWIGFLLMLAAGVIGGLMPLLNKKTLAHNSSLRVTTWTIVVGSLFFLPLGISNVEQVSWIHMPIIVWIAILFTALGATALCHFMWNYGVANIGVVRMTIYGYLPPILGVLLAALLLHDHLNPMQWCSAAITMGGIALSQYGKAR
jgi:drug/metabolite transporter (DMT)-like permease